MFLSLLTNAYNKGLLTDDTNFMDYITHGEDIENTMVLEYSVHAIQFAVAYEDLLTIYKAFNVQTATGIDLDIIGQLYFPRFPAAAAISDVTITLSDAITDDLLIPAGTNLMAISDHNIIFITMADATIYHGETVVTVPVQCIMNGPVGNINAHDLEDITVSGYALSVDNPYPATGGVNLESDGNYRSRLLNWPYINIRGTYNSVVNAIRSVSSVVGFYIDRFWDGYGSTKIIIDPPIQLVIDEVTTAVDAVKALDEYYLYLGVESVPVNITVEVNVSIDQVIHLSSPDKEAIGLLVRNCVETYLNGGTDLTGNPQPGLGIGNDFIPFQMERYIAEQIDQVKNIVTTYPTDVLSITSSQKGVMGTVNVTVI